MASNGHYFLSHHTLWTHPSYQLYYNHLHPLPGGRWVHLFCKIAESVCRLYSLLQLIASVLVYSFSFGMFLVRSKWINAPPITSFLCKPIVVVAEKLKQKFGPSSVGKAGPCRLRNNSINRRRLTRSYFSSFYGNQQQQQSHFVPDQAGDNGRRPHTPLYYFSEKEKLVARLFSENQSFVKVLGIACRAIYNFCLFSQL